ncbi:uncharacterized protein K452DRAFT_195993, partial [Aplosporella prunicola CBS 121167]
LKNCPPYAALSYTWTSPIISDAELKNGTGTGLSESYHEIECNGRSHMINDSLYQALLQFSRIKETAQQHLWADALCIDQTNIPERGAQVALMGEIYASCARVVVWLG